MKVMTERRPDPREMQTRAAQKPKKAPKPPKALKAIEDGPLGLAVALMFWTMRNTNPEFSAVITEQDVADFKASLDYNEQVPEIVVEAREKFVVIRVRDAKTGDQIRVSESSEEQLAIGEAAKRARRLREQTPVLVSTVKGELAQGIISNESINAVCDAALAMARG